MIVRKNIILKLMFSFLIVCCFFIGTSCKKKNNNLEGNKLNMNERIFAQIEFSSGDKVNLELFYDKAPKSVENFIKLAQDDFYNGTIFHRVIQDFMIQIGGYYLDGNNLMPKGEVDSIYGEFSENGWTQNDISHELGVISMARATDPNSASSQFFLCSDDCKGLDGKYAAFGKTTDEDSNQVILKISKMPTVNIGGGFTDFPYNPISIVKVRIQNEKF